MRPIRRCARATSGRSCAPTGGSNGLSQEKLATALGYDKTCISMIETGRRAVHDVATRRHIGKTLAIPSHLLGVTDPADTEFVAMVAFAESAIRLADLVRSAGRAAEAVNELWPLAVSVIAAPFRMMS